MHPCAGQFYPDVGGFDAASSARPVARRVFASVGIGVAQLSSPALRADWFALAASEHRKLSRPSKARTQSPDHEATFNALLKYKGASVEWHATVGLDRATIETSATNRATGVLRGLNELAM